MSTPLRVLTLNVLNVADRWPERLPLLRDGFAELRPDVAGLQEVVYPIDQERAVASTAGVPYLVHRGWADRPSRGNSLLVDPTIRGATAAGGDVERLALGHGRSAVRCHVTIGRRRAQLVTTHLHHLPADEVIRERQVVTLIDWLRHDAADVTIVTGDFNAEPDEVAARRMAEAGFRSAFAEANGADPPLTFPTRLEAPGREDYIGWPEGCLDYIWIDGDVAASSARLCFDHPAPHDPTLYPSDHVGLFVELAVG